MFLMEESKMLRTSRTKRTAAAFMAFVLAALCLTMFISSPHIYAVDDDPKPSAAENEDYIKTVDDLKGKKIGTTLIGNSNYEAGGNAKKIYDIIADTCDDVDLYIYDFEQENYKEKIRNTFVGIVKDYKTNNITLEEYQDRMKKFCWEKSFGIYTPMPDMSLTEIRNEIKRLKYND